jgi:hypothetical protein
VVGGGAARPTTWSELLDHFDDAVRPRVHKNRPIVDDSVSIFADAVFLRNIVIGHARLGQNSAYPNVLIVAVGRIMTIGHVAPESRSCVHSQHAVDAAHDTTDDPAYDGADRPGRTLSFARAALDPSRHTLRRRSDGHRYDGSEDGNQETTTYLHLNVLL